jgi:hypothetical protein
MKLSSLFAFVALTSTLALTGCAADSSEGPAQEAEGDAVDNDVTSSPRQDQLNGLRVRVAKDFTNVRGVKLVFSGVRIKSQGNITFIQARIMKRDAQGRTMELSNADLDGSVYASEIRDGLFDGPNVIAALKKTGTTWSVITKGRDDEAYVVGPTDVAWTEWESQYGVPSALMF